MSAKPPWPIMEIAVEPRSRADAERLSAFLLEMAEADATCSVLIDEESGQTILGGAGEEHLDRVATAIVKAGLQVNFGAPQVAYREALGRRAVVDRSHKVQYGGAGEFARVRLAFEPGERGSGFRFENLAGEAVPSECAAGVAQGLEAARQLGLYAGFPVIDFKAVLIDGAYHDVDSSARIFEIAARNAFRELRELGEPVLLEPVMRIEVTAPAEYAVDVVRDLASRRGEILSDEALSGERVVTALVPLANMFLYAGSLRGMTEDRGRFDLVYDHYAPLPRSDGPDDLFPSAIGMRA